MRYWPYLILMKFLRPMSKDLNEKELKQRGGTKSDARKRRTITRMWSSALRDRNPRIVRASKAFGGKDRHSKVSTVRGLKDRRVRMSAHAAIQLYDLQEKLGLSQPSKVVDWLIDAARHEIDKLPPLPAIPGNLIQLPPSHYNVQNVSCDAFSYNVQQYYEKSSAGIIASAGKCHDDEINCGMAYSYCIQLDPNVGAPGSYGQPMRFPSAFSSDGNHDTTGNFEIPITFAQLLPLIAGRGHGREQ